MKICVTECQVVIIASEGKQDRLRGSRCLAVHVTLSGGREGSPVRDAGDELMSGRRQIGFSGCLAHPAAPNMGSAVPGRVSC